MDVNRELSWLRKVRDLSHRLSTEENLAGLFPRLLDDAIELTQAERGFLVVLQGRKPDGSYGIEVVAARGFGRSAVAGWSPPRRARTGTCWKCPAFKLAWCARSCSYRCCCRAR